VAVSRLIDRSKQFEPPTDKKPVRQPGVRAGLDAVARGATAVRSAAEDERRSREQSVRARY